MAVQGSKQATLTANTENRLFWLMVLLNKQTEHKQDFSFAKINSWAIPS